MSLTNREVKKILSDVQSKARIFCETGHDLIQKLMKNKKNTVKLLRPRGGVFNLSNIFLEYKITSKEEEANFVKKVNHFQNIINRRVRNGLLSFDKMDEATTIEFILGVVGRFEK